MGNAADWFLAALPGLILLRGMAARVDVYDTFLDGAKQGLRTGAGIFPALTGMLLLLGVMRTSGLTEALAEALSPVLAWMNLPGEIAQLLLLRPLTGSGSMAALKEIFAQCGVDSRAGRIGAVLVSSSETIFYTMTVYLSATGVRKLPYVAPVSLFSFLIGALVAGFLL